MRLHRTTMKSGTKGPEQTCDKVLEAFAAVFKETKVALDDDFFDLGGDSLLAEDLAMRLTEIAGKEVRISALFDYPTPNAMSSFLWTDTPVATSVNVGRPPIFMVHGASGYTMPKPLFFKGLAPEQRLVLLQIPGLSGDRSIPDDIPSIAAAYVDQIEHDWPDGRLHISSFCNGALIAIEMTGQLAKRGRQVDHMVLLDPGVPKVIEAIHRGRAAKLKARLGFFFLTGRFSGGTSMEDVHDSRIRSARAYLHYIENRVRKLRARLTGHKAYRFKPGQNLWAQSRIHAANNHYWPQIHTKKVDVICAHERLAAHNDTSSFWRQILPDMVVWSVVEKHADVTGAESSVSAEKMQLLFDRSEGRLS